jgi:hypothetical protein
MAAMLAPDPSFSVNRSFYFTLKCTQDFLNIFLGPILIILMQKKLSKRNECILQLHLITEDKD